MPRFFADSTSRFDNIFDISGEDAHHISRSLRMRVGEKISVVSGGKDYFCEIIKITDSDVYAKILCEEASNEPSIYIRLFQAIPKQDKLESVIQKSVELGVSEIIPVLTKRCISRPEPSQFEKKSDRLKKISESAAKQSGRGIIPKVKGIVSLEDCLFEMKKCDLPLMCYEKKGGKHLLDIDFSGVKTVGLLVGSEGGFEPFEADMAVAAGAVPIWLGKRILRCETAPLAAVSVIMALTGNM